MIQAQCRKKANFKTFKTKTLHFGLKRKYGVVLNSTQTLNRNWNVSSLAIHLHTCTVMLFSQFSTSCFFQKNQTLLFTVSRYKRPSVQIFHHWGHNILLLIESRFEDDAFPNCISWLRQFTVRLKLTRIKRTVM